MYTIVEQMDIVNKIIDQSEKNDNSKPYQVAVFSGGGLGAIKYLNALEKIALQENFSYEKMFDCYVGSSAGSIVATGLANNISISYIHKVANTIGRDIFNAKQITLESLLNKGLISKEPLVKGLRENFLIDDETFKDLQAATKKDLVIVASQLDDHMIINFSSETHPDVNVLQAVSASCSIPYIYPSETINGIEYVDGAYFSAAPVLNAIYHAVFECGIKLEDLYIFNVVCILDSIIEPNDLKIPFNAPKIAALELNNLASLHMAIGNSLLQDHIINLVVKGKDEIINEKEIIEYLREVNNEIDIRG